VRLQSVEEYVYNDLDMISEIWYNENGTKLVPYTYDAWGNATVSGNTSLPANKNPFRYRGYYYDADLGLYYLNSRYYDSNTGRFISADGYVSTGQGLIGNNMYAYCNNNPVMNVDPNGGFTKGPSMTISRTTTLCSFNFIEFTEAVERKIDSWTEKIKSWFN
jgi:RHS repeat-associated protein